MSWLRVYMMTVLLVTGAMVSWGQSVEDVFSFLKIVRSGEGIYEQVSYDGVTALYRGEEDSMLRERLAQVHTPGQLRALVKEMLPATAAYDTLSTGLTRALVAGDRSKIYQLSIALNIYRWIHHHSFPRCIVINVASAALCYYEQDTLRLRMKVVVGKPSTRTPRFAAWCNEVILYPYWNIPRKIAVTEFLPMFKRMPTLPDVMNIQLLDSRGKIVDPVTIDWKRWDREDFPYSMRQSTGCDNALGVIKFDLTSPYDVYMHDTNLRSAFRSDYRYYSHGCIRLEKPFELGDALFGGKLDTTFLASCLKDQQPRSLRLDQSVPVFVVYLTADIDADGKLSFYRDIYHLLK